MSIDGVSGKTSYIGTSIINMRAQLEALTTQLATGKASTTYAGQGIDRGFALSLRAQINTINSFSDTAKNVNTRLSVANLALQGLSDINAQVKKASTTATLVLNNNGQTSGQITAQAAFANAVAFLNSQSGDRYLFSGRATDTAATVSADVMLGGTATQAGLTQLIKERLQADQGIANMGRLSVSSPPLTTTVTSVAEDGSPFGLKLLSVQSSLTGATVTQPAGTPPAATIDLGAVNPNEGDKIKFNFSLPDGSTEIDRADSDDEKPAAVGLVPDRHHRRSRGDDDELAGDIDVLDQDVERHLAGGCIGHCGVGQFLQPVGNDRRKRGQQPGCSSCTDHRRDAVERQRSIGFAGHELRGWRHHHGQRHADHLRDIRCDRQPAQYH